MCTVIAFLRKQTSQPVWNVSGLCEARQRQRPRVKAAALSSGVLPGAVSSPSLLLYPPTIPARDRNTEKITTEKG